MIKFSAKLEIIGINPFVFVPKEILAQLFNDAGKDKGYIPISGLINDKPYKQTLVKYRGDWRLYVNMVMLKDSPKRIGETLTISVGFDPVSRAIEPPLKFVTSLDKNSEAKQVFDNLTASKKNEIIRYLANLKTEESLDKNVKRAINFLLGNERFIGRDKP